MECGAKQFLSGLAARAAPFALFEELARTTEPDSAERRRVPDRL